MIDNDDFGIFSGDKRDFYVNPDKMENEDDLIKDIEDQMRNEFGYPYYYDKEEWIFDGDPVPEYDY